jgi:hypothetical protein
MDLHLHARKAVFQIHLIKGIVHKERDAFVVTLKRILKAPKTRCTSFVLFKKILGEKIHHLRVREEI